MITNKQHSLYNSKQKYNFITNPTSFDEKYATNS